MDARSRIDSRRALAGPPRLPPRRPRATAWGFFFMGKEDTMRSSTIKLFFLTPCSEPSNMHDDNLGCDHAHA
jgi:hypothetical protein